MKMLLGIKRTGKMEASDGASTRGQRVHRRIRWPQQSNAGTEAPYSEAEGGGRGGGGGGGIFREEIYGGGEEVDTPGQRGRNHCARGVSGVVLLLVYCRTYPG